jgi:hypothetical protein
VITSRRQLLAVFGLALPAVAVGAAPALAATSHTHHAVHKASAHTHHTVHKTTAHRHVAHKTSGHKRVAHHSPAHHPTAKKQG